MGHVLQVTTKKVTKSIVHVIHLFIYYEMRVIYFNQRYINYH